jgi:hypothetical protein
MPDINTITKPLSHLCHKCGDAAEGYYCAECREAVNENRRNRNLVRFRNCYCGSQARHTRDGAFFCGRHYMMERMREFQDPQVTAENIRRSNLESEKRRYSRLKELGVCVTCAKAEAYFGCIRCHACQAKRRALNARSKGTAAPALPIHPFKFSNNVLFAHTLKARQP